MTLHSVLISSQDTLMGTALAQLIGSSAEFTATPTSTFAATALQQELRQATASLVVIVAGNEESKAVELIQELSRQKQPARIIALVNCASSTVAARVYNAGARGVVGSDASPAELFAALREVHEGHLSASRSVLRMVCDFMCASSSDDAPLKLPPSERLSMREHAVVSLLTQGMTNGEIARELFIAEPTVKAHLSRVMTKWKVRDRVQVVIRAMEIKLVELPENSIRLDFDGRSVETSVAQHPSNSRFQLNKVPS